LFGSWKSFLTAGVVVPANAGTHNPRKGLLRKLSPRHCEERSDEAIQGRVRGSGLLPPSREGASADAVASLAMTGWGCHGGQGRRPVVMGPGVRQDDCVGTWVYHPATESARALLHSSPSPKSRGRREGRVAAAPGALAQKKFARGAWTTGTGGDNRPSLRDGLRLTSCSPR
jgi:hypothetical protein